MGMPLLNILTFLFILSNISFPGSLNFIGELFIIFLSCEYSFIHAFILSLGSFLGIIYSLYFYQRIFTGKLNKYLIIGKQINKEEFICLLFLFLPILLMGLFPLLIIRFLFN